MRIPKRFNELTENQAERIERDEVIVYAYHSGATVAMLARVFKLDPSRVRAIVRKRKKRVPESKP